MTEVERQNNAEGSEDDRRCRRHGRASRRSTENINALLTSRATARTTNDPLLHVETLNSYVVLFVIAVHKRTYARITLKTQGQVYWGHGVGVL